jgi:tetratricopeptide (TPR) repeat protein
LEVDIDNFRAVVDWAAGRGGEGASIVARLGGALWRFLWTYGYLSEGRRWLEAAVQSPTLTPSVRARALYPAGILAHEQGDTERSESFFEESLAIRRELGDKRGIADSLNALGMVAKHKEDYGQATERFQESLALRGELEDRQGISIALNNLGGVAHSKGDFAEAARMYEQSLQLEREFGDNQGIAAALNNLAEVAADRGDPSRAFELYRESLALCRELGDKQGMLVSLEGLAVSAGALGEVKRAATLFGACAVLRESSGTQLEHGYLPSYEHRIAEVRAAMDPSAWQAVWEEGRTMSFEEAFLYALAVS